MLQLYPSNKTEYLSAVIARIMKAKPLSAPFAKEVVLIQSHGMGTWLQQGISQQLGIAAMIDCSMPASFIWQLSQILMPEDPHIPLFEKNNLRWEILKRLPEKLSDPRYKMLADYISAVSSGDSEYTFFELSDILADLFDAYQNYRPDWISDWEKGTPALALQAMPKTKSSAALDLESWQADLWRSLYPHSPLVDRNHRAILLVKLLERLQHLPKKMQNCLPERVFIFGLSALPPQWLSILTALSAYCDVHFLVQNPCRYYWGDVTSETQQLKLVQSLLAKGVSAETAADTFLEGNSLLASWGRLGRDYLSIIFQHEGIEEMPVDLYEDAFAQEECEATYALMMLQSDVLNLQSIKRPIQKADSSIRFSSCHSSLREVEALQDYLFKLLDTSSGLSPKDVIVMMPDVQDFAALIDAIFSRPAYDQYGQPQYLPYGISDQLLALDQPMVEVLSGILNLSSLRITATEVLDWLDIEAIRERFAISEDDLEQIHAWVSGLSIRWGLSEAHRDQCLSSKQASKQASRQILVKGSGAGNTWMSAFKRLLAGYVYGVEGVIHDHTGGVLAQSHSSRESQLLAGKLMRFLACVELTINQQQGQYSVSEWLGRVSGFWASWFDSEYLNDEVLRLMDLSVSSISEQIQCAGFEQTVGFPVISSVITASFEKERVSQRFLAGRINFCTLMPMRSIPFKVVCMLGMNEGQYPRPIPKNSFDLLSVSEARIGDRSRREDDRYLFLEAICSARTHLYISYCGHDIKDNSERYPSLLVSELRDYCAQYFYLEEAEDQHPSENLLAHWTINHRLQPFHACYYRDLGNVLPRSYSTDWLSLYCDAHHQDTPYQDSNKEPSSTSGRDTQFDLFQVPEHNSRTIELSSLTRMADHPLRYFYQHILGLSYSGIEAELEDSEPFALSHLDRYFLKADMAQIWNDSSPQDVYEQWSLADRLPRAPVDQFYIEEAESAISPMTQALDCYKDCEHLSIELVFGSDHLLGELLIANVKPTSKSLVELSISKTIASRFFGFWVKHVFWSVHCGRQENCARQQEKVSGKSVLICTEAIWTLPILALEAAERYAGEIIELFIQLDKKPSPFLAKSTFAQLFNERKVKSVFKGSRTRDIDIDGECEDPYWQRFCLLSDYADNGITRQQPDELPDLTASLFYKQVFENIDQIEVENIEIETPPFKNKKEVSER